MTSDLTNQSTTPPPGCSRDQLRDRPGWYNHDRKFPSPPATTSLPVLGLQMLLTSAQGRRGVEKRAGRGRGFFTQNQASQHRGGTQSQETKILRQELPPRFLDLATP